MQISEREEEWQTLMQQCAKWSFVAHTSLLFDIRPMQQAFVKASIEFINGAVLHLREFIDCSESRLVRLSYSYHAQTAHQDLLFRYDNAPHKPPLGFVEHKHCEDGSIIASPPPELADILEEMIRVNKFA
jgi:hypothetical protein